MGKKGISSLKMGYTGFMINLDQLIKPGKWRVLAGFGNGILKRITKELGIKHMITMEERE